MKRLLFAVIAVTMGSLAGCGQDTSVTATLEEDYGIRTLKNGSEFEGQMRGEDEFHVYLLELSSQEEVTLLLTGSDDLELRISSMAESGWAVLRTVDHDGGEGDSDREVISDVLGSGKYSVTVERDGGFGSVSYSLSASW